MAEDPRFILHFKTLAKFKLKLADGTVSENRHLVFIKDEKLLWCRGIYYSDAEKLDNFNSYYNDWKVNQTNATTLDITLKGNLWNATNRLWEAISKKITLNSATSTISGLMSALDKRLLDIIDTANFLLADPTTNATTVTINATHTDVNGETRNLKTSKNLTTATSTKAGILTALDKRLLDIISTANYELTAPTTTAENIILHTKRTNVNAETHVTDPETEATRTLPAVTESKAGVMIATDKIAINNLIKLKKFSHLNDDNLFTRTANDVSINYQCRGTDNDTSAASTDHSINIGAVSHTLAGVMIATDKIELDRISTANFALGTVTPTTEKIQIAASKTNITNNATVANNIDIPAATRDKAGLVTNTLKLYLDAINTIGNISNLTSITTDTNNVYLNYKDVNKVGLATSSKTLTIPTATIGKAGVITDVEKRKLNQISYTDGDTNTTAGITGITFSAGKTDSASIGVSNTNDNSKIHIDISDNFGNTDDNDLFLVRGNNGNITSENNVRFLVGKTVLARSKNNILERVLTTVDLSDGSVTKVGTATIGSSTKPIYLSGGVPTASNSTVGSGINPVYLNAGTITRSSSTVGSGTKLVYLNAGTVTESSSTVGSNIKPVYLNAGTITASTGNVGSGTNPVYMNAGTVTASTSSIGASNKPVYMSSGAITASTSTVGGKTLPVYMSGGTITASDGSVGSSTKPIYMSGGILTASSSTVGSGIKPTYLSSGTITESASTVGSSVNPVYMSSGTITATSYSFGNGNGNVPISNGTVNTNLNADKLDGLHESAFARKDLSATADLNTVNGSGIMTNSANANATEARHYPIAEAGTLIYGTAAYNSANLIYGTFSTNRWFVRGGGQNASSKTAWKELLHTGNYSTTLDTRYYTEAEIDSKVSTINSSISTTNSNVSANKTAIDNHKANKSNPHAVTKAQVGLGNVTNESKATMFTSPTFTGTPTAPTAAKGTNTTQIATTAFVLTAATDAVTKIVANAPASFDTLKEISDWISTHADSASAMNTLILTNKTNIATNATNIAKNKTAIETNATAIAANKTSINTNATNIATLKSKLDGIASGAEVNVLSDWSVTNTSSDAYIKNKPTSMPASDVYSWAKASTKPTYSWTEITNRPSNATSTTGGFMSASDKAKLDGIATGANKYELPKASSTILGGIKVGTNLSIDTNGTLSATDTKYTAASTTAAGLMSKEDKVKLDGIATGANNYSLPLAASNTRGGVKIGYTTTGKNYAVLLSNEQMYVNVPWLNTTYSNASTTAAGLMSATDKSKLDGISIGANKYTLPTASNSALGGVKVSGNGLYMNNGYICTYECDVLGNLGYLTDFTTTLVGNLNDSIGSNKGVISNWLYNCLMRTMATFHTNVDFNLSNWWVSDPITSSCNRSTGYQFLIPSLRGRYHKGTPTNNEFLYQFSILPPNCSLGLNGPYIQYLNQTGNYGSGEFTCLKIDTTNGNIHIPNMSAKASGKLYFKNELVVVGAATESELGGIKVWSGTKAQYNAITTKLPDCLYLITE